MLLTNPEVRAILLAHGFTIKEGLDDLKPYVYEAAAALEAAVLARAPAATSIAERKRTLVEQVAVMAQPNVTVRLAAAAFGMTEKAEASPGARPRSPPGSPDAPPPAAQRREAS